MRKYLLGTLLIGLLYFPCYISNSLLTRLTEEDGFYENVGALLFLLTAIVFFILAINPHRFTGYKNNEKYPQRIYFWLLAVLFFFAFGEEISWGQRIFGFDTPQFIKERNIQEEFNLHNLEIFHGKTTEGEDKTGLMALFTMHRMFYIFLFTYLLIIPLLYRWNAKIKAFIDKLGLPIPNLIFGVLLAINMIYGNSLRAALDSLDGHSIVEIKEFAIALIIFALAISWYRVKKITSS